MVSIYYNLIFLLVVLGVANIAYKGKVFDNHSWNRVTLLSLWFILCLLILLWKHIQVLNIIINFLLVGLFSLITIVWFLSPKIVRMYGKFPHGYLKDKKGNTRFMVRFEYPSITIKYFEVLFQQATFLFMIFVVFSGYSQAQITLYFTSLVAVIHLGNLLFLEHKWAMFYFFLSIPMALLFGFLITRGLILVTFSLHLLFYLLFNGKYWFNDDIISASINSTNKTSI